MSEAPVGSRGGVGPSTCQMTSSCCMALAGSRTAAGDAQVIQSVWTGWGQFAAIVASQVRVLARVHVLLVRTKRMLLGHNKDRL